MLPSETTSLPPFASMLPPFPGTTLGPTDEIYGDGGTVAFEEDNTNWFDLLDLAPGQKRGHDDDLFGNYDGTETLLNKRPRHESTPDETLPFSPLDLSAFQLEVEPIKEESPTAMPHGAYPQKQDEPTLSELSSLGSWAETLTAADKQVALQLLRLPTDELVERMFHTKSRYERKVRTVVKSLKDELQLAKDANTIILDQFIQSSHRERDLDGTLTELRWQLSQQEQVNNEHLVTIQLVSSRAEALEKQASDYQKELEKPAMKWNEKKDSIQIDMGVPISVQTALFGVLFPARLQDSTLTLSYLKRITDIKKIWSKYLPGEAITKIEYIMNDDLYALFKAAKTDLEKHKRPCTEKILFHGTAAGNIDRYGILLPERL